MQNSQIRFLLMAIIAVVFSFGCASTQNMRSEFINKYYVQRTLNFLSADDMRGRDAFEEEIRAAAVHIASEFEKAGLQPLPGESGFIQEIPMWRSVPVDGYVEIGSQRISAHNLFTQTDALTINTVTNDNWQVQEAKQGENLFAAYRKMLSTEGNVVLVVDTSFTEMFRRLQGRTSPFMKPNGQKVMVLTSHKPQGAVRLNIANRVTQTSIENVVGMLPGKSRSHESVVFSAHYDHIGVGRPDERGDSIYNGANDNASGTTAVLALARHFGEIKNNERSLVFAAFTAEESGGFGSRYFSSRLNPDNIAAMINIEMIGTDSKWGKNSVYMTGYEMSSLGPIMAAALENCGSRNCPFRLYPDPYPDQQLFYRSDNATLARLGVPAHTISTSKMDVEPHYHKASDEVSTLDVDNMVMVIRAIAEGSKGLISGTETPTRVAVENLRQ